MKFYFAPMEGITGYVYRNLYHSYFQEIDKYFTPFIVGNKKAGMKARELKDVLPENNEGIPVVPQILTNNAEEFINTARRIQQLGYTEINLNLGCPSGTVVSKGRGAGFLACPKQLNAFLDEIFHALSDMKISIKTRLGMEFVSEFEELLEIYSDYPLHELIVHPRVRKELYSGKPHLEEFEMAREKCAFSVCYNGDIFTPEDYEEVTKHFPGMEMVMIGRGLLANPFLIRKIQGKNGITKAFVEEFSERLFDEYRKVLSGDKDVLFKLKELWNYQIWMFDDDGKYVKAIRKAQNRTEYQFAVRNLLNNCPILEDSGLFSRKK